MYDAFHRCRDDFSPQRLIDVRYEDLIAQPVDTMRNIYETLRLSDFEPVEDSIRNWADHEHRHYKTNQHQLDADTEALIRREWSDYFTRYQYD